MEKLLDAINAKVMPAEHEYIGEDGLTHCSVCHQATQVRIDGLPGLIEPRVVRCICACRKAELEQEKEQKRREECERRRSVCFVQTNMADWTFANDDRKNPKLSDAMLRYAQQFPTYLKSGKGLLLHGTVGTGKTYYAACIANHVIDNGYRALMTNFARLTNQIQGMYEGKQQYIDDLNRYQLLILDDLGAERKSEFMQEMVFNIIDTRYRAGLPFIVTTNLTGDEITKAGDISYQRIYDRVLERCFPVEVSGGSRRREALRNTHADMRDQLGL